MKIKNILFPTDFSFCANQALEHALLLARSHKATLHMLHALVLHESDPFYPAYHFPDSEDLNKRLESISISQMDNDLKKFDAHNLRIEKTQRRGVSTATVILEYVQQEDIDVIVMGTHGRRGLGHVFLGSVAEEVVRVAPCPVFTIREQKHPKPMEHINKILVPIDFSSHSKLALAYAKSIAKTYDSSLQILHVVEDKVHPAFYVTGKDTIFDFMPQIKSKSTELATKLLNDLKSTKVPAEIFIIEGIAAKEIVNFADENETDLIVISTHGLTGVEHFFLGSVTEKVVRRSPCPVFTVKSFGKKLIEIF